MSGLVEIGKVVFEKKIFKFHQSIFSISLLSPFEQTWISFTYGCFALSLVEIGTVILERIFLYWTGRQRETATGDQKSYWDLNSGELKQPEVRPLDMPIFKTCANAISSSSVELTLYVLVLCLHGRRGLGGRVFDLHGGDRGSIPGHDRLSRKNRKW